MIDLREIYETIDEIRKHGTTVGQAEKLALLYIAADYMEKEEAARNRTENAQNYARAAETESLNRMPMVIETSGRSQFLAACDGVLMEDALNILDEHMEAIKVLYPKEYQAIVERLEDKK